MASAAAASRHSSSTFVQAARALGDTFDLRGFHDEVLRHGCLPLHLLEDQVARGEAAARQRVSDGRHDPGVLQLPRRQVDRDGEPVGSEILLEVA